MGKPPSVRLDWDAWCNSRLHMWIPAVPSAWVAHARRSHQHWPADPFLWDRRIINVLIELLHDEVLTEIGQGCRIDKCHMFTVEPRVRGSGGWGGGCQPGCFRVFWDIFHCKIQLKLTPERREGKGSFMGVELDFMNCNRQHVGVLAPQLAQGQLSWLEFCFCFMLNGSTWWLAQKC